MDKELKELLEANFQAMRARIQSGTDIQDLVHQEVKKQNGRITELEKETLFFRLIHRNPTKTTVVFVLIIFGLLFAIERGWFSFLSF